MIGTREAAAMLGCKRRAVAYHIRRGHFQSAAKAAGERWTLDADEVRRFAGKRHPPAYALSKAAAYYGQSAKSLWTYLHREAPSRWTVRGDRLTEEQALEIAVEYGKGRKDLKRLSAPQGKAAAATLTGRDVAKRLGYSESTVSTWLREGLIKGRKERGQWRIPAAEAERRFAATLPPEHYTTESAAYLLGRSKDFVQEHIRRGHLKATRGMGRGTGGWCWHIAPDDFNDFRRRLPTLTAEGKTHEWHSHKKGARSNASA